MNIETRNNLKKLNRGFHMVSNHFQSMLLSIESLACGIKVDNPDGLVQVAYSAKDTIESMKKTLFDLVKNLKQVQEKLNIKSEGVEEVSLGNASSGNERWKVTQEIAYGLKQPLSAIKGLEFGNDISRDKVVLGAAVEAIEELVQEIAGKCKDPLGEKAAGVGLSDLCVQIKKMLSVVKDKNPGLELDSSITNSSIFSNISVSCLRRILFEIFQNSIEANSRKIYVSCEFNNEKAIIKIEDNGTGIPQDVLNSLFEEEATSKENRNGLSLYYAREWLDKIGGQIRVESSKRSTKFTLSIPAASRMILIDDNESLCSEWKKIAEHRGHQLKTYRSYSDLFECINRHSKSEFLFCDVSTEEDINGVDATRKLHELGFKNTFLQTGATGMVDQDDAPHALAILDKCYPVKV